MNALPRPTRAISSMRMDILRGACYFFLAIGLLALGYAGFSFADSRAYQALEMKKFKQAGRLSEPRNLVEGDVIGEIQVPRLRLNAMVVQGDSPANLKRAVGHLIKSALPGEWGNVALAGHRDTFFRPLRDIRLGDEIRFKTRERNFEYRVESIEVVVPTDIRVLKSSTGHDLTLLTCFPIYYIGPAPKRLVVRAREVDGMVREQFARENEVKGPGGPLSFHRSFEAGTSQ
jgi:sortase A